MAQPDDSFVFLGSNESVRYGLDQLDKIRCPDCGNGYLLKVPAKDIWLCKDCGLRLLESQLGEAVTVIPDTNEGVSINSKPYFNQITQNKKVRNEHYIDGREYVPALASMQDQSNTEILKKYSLTGLSDSQRDKEGGIKISRHGKKVKNADPETQQAVNQMVKKLFPSYASDVKIDLH